MTGNTESGKSWNWVGRYVAVIVLALILGAAIGGMPLFAKTFLVSGKLNAAQVVRFLGYGTALIVFWILGRRLTMTLRQQRSGRWAALHGLILPIVTLIVVSAMYSVILLVLGPLLGGELQKIYDWFFIVAIIACAIWLIMAVLGQADALTEALTGGARGAKQGAGACASCGTVNDVGANRCAQCGQDPQGAAS